MYVGVSGPASARDLGLGLGVGHRVSRCARGAIAAWRTLVTRGVGLGLKALRRSCRGGRLLLLVVAPAAHEEGARDHGEGKDPLHRPSARSSCRALGVTTDDHAVFNLHSAELVAHPMPLKSQTASGRLHLCVPYLVGRTSRQMRSMARGMCDSSFSTQEPPLGGRHCVENGGPLAPSSFSTQEPPLEGRYCVEFTSSVAASRS